MGTASPLEQPWERQGRADRALGPSQTVPVLSSAVFGVTVTEWAGRDLRVKCDFSSQFLVLMLPFLNNRSKTDLSEPCPSSTPAASFGLGQEGISRVVPFLRCSTHSHFHLPSTKSSQSSSVPALCKCCSSHSCTLFPREPSPASFLFKDYK